MGSLHLRAPVQREVDVVHGRIGARLLHAQEAPVRRDGERSVAVDRLAVAAVVQDARGAGREPRGRRDVDDEELVGRREEELLARSSAGHGRDGATIPKGRFCVLATAIGPLVLGCPAAQTAIRSTVARLATDLGFDSTSPETGPWTLHRRETVIASSVSVVSRRKLDARSERHKGTSTA
jgi:hypothetical protein